MSSQFITSVGRRRGAVIVQAAVLMTVLLAFAALSVDVGLLYDARGELQRTADASAMAAASRLASFSEGDPMDLARQAAEEYAAANDVLGKGITLTSQDVEFGRAEVSEATGRYDFVPDVVRPNAVRVTVRRSTGTPEGPVPLIFANIFGFSYKNMWAQAAARINPRDVAIVADLSGSHNDDSELRHYQIADINLWEVWDALPGGIDAAEPNYDPQGNAGPGWGVMEDVGWGTMTIDADYDPCSDPGLLYMPRYQDWSDATIQALLQAQGYSAAEINGPMDGGYDGTVDYWRNRVAVSLGLAYWNSGMPGGLWQQLGLPKVGNGNIIVGSGETFWTESYPYDQGSWSDWIKNYIRSSGTAMYQANSHFRYRFGAKTLVNYLLESRPSHHQTPELANAPTYPMQAVKDSVQRMMEIVNELDSDDQVSLEVYGTTAHHEVNLIDDYFSISNHLNAMQAAHYDSWTNMGGGMEKGIQELTSDRARPSAMKVMIVLTDGKPNVDKYGHAGYQYEEEAKQYAMNEAQIADSLGITIYTVCVGAEVDWQLMQDIAETYGSGKAYRAEGSVEEYSAELEEIFETLGGRQSVVLIQ